MVMSKRDEDRARKKKQRREKRVRERRSGAETFRDESEAIAALRRLTQTLATHDVPGPTSWPGASDPSLARPDLVKFDLATYAINTEPGRSKVKQLEDGLSKGVIGYLPEMD